MKQKRKNETWVKRKANLKRYFAKKAEKSKKPKFLKKDIYINFYKSDWWKDLRNRKIKKTPYCEICSENEKLQVHHIGYEYFYSSLPSQALKYTIVLCQRCHETVHEIQKERKLNTKQTEEIINQLKEEAIKWRKLEEEWEREVFPRIERLFRV